LHKIISYSSLDLDANILYTDGSKIKTLKDEK